MWDGGEWDGEKSLGIVSRWWQGDRVAALNIFCGIIDRAYCIICVVVKDQLIVSSLWDEVWTSLPSETRKIDLLILKIRVFRLKICLKTILTYILENIYCNYFWKTCSKKKMKKIHRDLSSSEILIKPGTKSRKQGFKLREELFFIIVWQAYYYPLLPPLCNVFTQGKRRRRETRREDSSRCVDRIKIGDKVAQREDSVIYSRWICILVSNRCARMIRFDAQLIRLRFACLPRAFAPSNRRARSLVPSLLRFLSFPPLYYSPNQEE